MLSLASERGPRSGECLAHGSYSNWNTDSANASLPNIRNSRCIAVPSPQRFQPEVVFDRAQHIVVRVMPVQHIAILLVRLLYHVSQEERESPVIGIVA